MYIIRSNQTLIENNTIIKSNHSKTTYGIGFSTFPVDNYRINNNSIYNTPRAISLTLGTTNLRNINITNNYIQTSDIGIAIDSSSNVNIKNNILRNITSNEDGYNLGIYVYDKSSNINISGNDIEYGHGGIWVQRSNNVIYTRYNL